MHNIKAVVFDLDDTLINEYDYICSGFKEVSKHLEIQTGYHQTDIYEQLLNNFKINSDRVFNAFYENNNIKYTTRNISDLVKIYRNHNPEITLKKEVVSTLNTLTKLGYKKGIITDGYSESQQKKIKTLNLHNYVDHIVITDEIGREYWKPHIKPFELMSKALQVEFHEMIYVGDNPSKDFYIKSKVPIITIRINDSGLYSNKEYLNSIREDYQITSLPQLLEIVGEIDEN